MRKICKFLVCFLAIPLAFVNVCYADVYFPSELEIFQSSFVFGAEKLLYFLTPAFIILSIVLMIIKKASKSEDYARDKIETIFYLLLVGYSVIGSIILGGMIYLDGFQQLMCTLLFIILVFISNDLKERNKCITSYMILVVLNLLTLTLFVSRNNINNDVLSNVYDLISSFFEGIAVYIVFLISLVSFIILKVTKKKNDKPLSEEEKKIKRNKLQQELYACGILFAIIGHFYSCIKFELSVFWFFDGLSGIIASIIARLTKNKKASNIIGGIVIALIIVITIISQIQIVMINNYNKKFYNYIQSEESYLPSGRYVTNTKGLIEAAINNNKSGRKVTVIYNGTNYTTASELNQLLNIINNAKKYYVSEQYDKEDQYIEKITLIPYIYRRLPILANYQGTNNMIGNEVKYIISQIQDTISSYDDLAFNIIYTLEDGVREDIKVDSKSLNNQVLMNLITNVKVSSNYTVTIDGEGVIIKYNK